MADVEEIVEFEEDTERRTFKLPWSGLTCETCGEPLRTVDRTRRTAGFVIRERVCPKCGLKNKTAERVISVMR